MLTHFTLSSSLPALTGSTSGMGLVLSHALEAARATGGAAGDLTIADAAARNCIPSALAGPKPVGGARLLDILV
jgi:hypothetical protein